VISTSLGVRLLNFRVHFVKLYHIHTKLLSCVSAKTSEFLFTFNLIKKFFYSIEMDSNSEVLSDINSVVNFQGIATSPRKTRSGKIVKYRDE
jgi:hypothetical protein